MTRITRSSAIVFALTAMLALSACSTTASAETDSSSAPNPGAADARAFLDDYLENPTSIGLETALSAAPDSDRSIIYLLSPGPVAEVASNALATASAEVGWDYSAIAAGATPASAASAFEAAIARGPDAIIFAGYPAATFTKQIADANAAGITVLSNATGDDPVDGVLADIGGRADEEQFGKLTAAYFVSNAGPDDKAVVFNLSAFPILSLFTDAFVASVEDWCPDCEVEVVDQQFGDVGINTPANTVSYLQRNPDVKWAFYANGDLAQGVSAAVKGAGLEGIHIVGEVPTQANLANLATGEEAAWTGYPVDILSWRMIDLLARHFGGDDVAAAAAVTLPLQLITSDNVGDIVTRDGYYIGVDGFEDQFRALWKAS